MFYCIFIYMKDKKYDMFNLITGEFEEVNDDPSEFFDKLAKRFAKDTRKLYETYEAEREIVQSIIDGAITLEESNRSTD